MNKQPGDQGQTLQFESPHKFFHMMMNMCDDDLDLHQYRLYGHYLRVAGQQGKCDESVRTTASICRMGHTTVIRVRGELAKLGYIRVKEPTKEEAVRGETVKITIINRWAENIARYSKPEPEQEQANDPVPDEEHPVPDEEQVTAPGQEHPVPNGERKKNPVGKPVREKPKSKSSSLSSPSPTPAPNDDDDDLNSNSGSNGIGQGKTNVRIEVISTDLDAAPAPVPASQRPDTPAHRLLDDWKLTLRDFDVFKRSYEADFADIEKAIDIYGEPITREKMAYCAEYKKKNADKLVSFAYVVASLEAHYGKPGDPDFSGQPAEPSHAEKVDDFKRYENYELLDFKPQNEFTDKPDDLPESA